MPVISDLYRSFYAHPAGKQIVDQAGHVLGGAIVTSPALLIGYQGHAGSIAIVATALLCGLYREVSQLLQKRKGHRAWHFDNGLDTVWHAPGGLLVAYVSGVIG